MKLEDKLRQGLLGHLSEANTQVDITIACNITRDFAVSFSVFVAEKYFEYIETYDTLEEAEIAQKENNQKTLILQNF